MIWIHLMIYRPTAFVEIVLNNFLFLYLIFGNAILKAVIIFIIYLEPKLSKFED